MSLRRSDHPATAADSGWRATLLSNAPLPVLIALLVPLGWWVASQAFGHYNERILMLIGFNIILAVSLQLINGFSGQFSLGHAGFMAVGAYLAAYPAMNYANQFHDPGLTLLFFLSLGITVGIAAAVVGGMLVLLRLTRKMNRWLPGILIVALLAWILVDFASAARGVASGILVWARAVAALERLFAWILTEGGPLSSKVSGVLPPAVQQPLCFLILLCGGGACAAVVGFIVGLPALRLRGDYLAIATLGLAEIIRIAIQNSPPLGGALGLTPIPKYTDFPWLYGCVVVTVVAIWRLAYSPKGRAIMAVREDEIAAAAVGLSTTQYKVTSFVIGAFFAGVAGALYSLHERSITPTSFGLQKSIEIVVMVTLGGLGSISGAILAAVVLTVLPEVLRPIADYRMVLYSLLLVVMMLLRPQGLLGGWELWPTRRGHLRPPAPTAEEPVPA